MTKPHIVILGAGFAGTYTARRLEPLVKKGVIDLTIVNRTNYFLFTPLLHEAATGGISVTSTAESLQEIFRNSPIKVRETEALGVDSERRVLKTKDGDINYDYLVVSAGAETNFYNVPGAKENSLVLKNLLDAVTIRDRIITAFEKAAVISNVEERKKMLTFVVVGGGPTGVELVAEIAELVYETLCPYYSATGVSCDGASVVLLSGDKNLLMQLDPKVGNKAQSVLKKKGVTVKLQMLVTKVNANGVEFGNGDPLAANTIIWVGGVKPYDLAIPGTEKHQTGRIKIDSFLRAIGTSAVQTIFVAGDIAALEVPSKGDKPARPLPMLAQVAEEQSKVLAHNIMAAIQNAPQKMKAFHYKSKGTLVSLGQWSATGDIFGIQIGGPIAWWIWRTVYLFKFNSWRKRFKIAAEWTINLFYSRDITKLR